ncbi:MAG TPA: tetratricopeptide repeat protein, partial [Acidobacteriota bacterium]|nr:tetratricopeptide repeat protein [Acidobacteriota bacterium]
MIMGALHARMGNRDEARAIISRLQERATERYVPPMAFALVCFALGETDTAFDWLEKAYAERDGYLISIRSDPATDPIRDDPRYRSLLKRMGLDQ